MTRLLAAIVAPVVVVLALVVGRPGPVGDEAMTSIGEIGAGATPARVGAELGTSVPTQRNATSRAGASQVADASALSVSIDAMTPSVVPRRGPVTIRGRVANTTDETWSGLNVYPCTSSRPMTTAAELREAVESAPEAGVCTRSRYFEDIPDLAPGQAARYLLRVEREDLGIPTAEGVYWMNVQVLGENVDGRDTISDGRARSFLPLVEGGAEPVTTSVVVPVRRGTLRDAEGRVADAAEWSVDLAPGGRLHNLLGFAEGAQDTPLTLVIDPAVLEAVRQLAAGNPPRDLEPTPGRSAEEDPGADAEPDAEADAEAEPDPDADAQSAQAWLNRMLAVARDHRVLGLPYGDLDLPAAARYDPTAYERATEASDRSFEGFGITATPAVVPPAGLLTTEGLELTQGAAATVLLATEALPEELATAEQPPPTVTLDGRTIGAYDASVATGGPGPDNRWAAIALRQRVLSEAALRSLGGDQRPLVVNLPGDFDPGRSTARFFRGLKHPFLAPGADPVGLPVGAPEIDELTYPRRQVERELWAANFERAEELRRTGEVLDRLLPENDTVGGVVAQEALGTTSYALREDPYAAANAANAATSWINSRLARVTISGPSFVILSSDSGPFSVTVGNGLNQAIRIRIRARTRDGLEIKAPEFIELAADSQQTITLTARSESIGVHAVTLLATDEKLVPLGASEEISIRSNQVGRVIWVIMGAGVGILFLAIAIRLTRRIRSARAS